MTSLADFHDCHSCYDERSIDQKKLVKVDHCDSVATVLRQWEMPCGTAAEGVRIRFDPCWKNYVQLTSCTWRPFARPLRHQ